jgi:hypothetical protein
VSFAVSIGATAGSGEGKEESVGALSNLARVRDEGNSEKVDIGKCVLVLCRKKQMMAS